MNAELREKLGKAAFLARQEYIYRDSQEDKQGGISWEELPGKDYKESFRVEAEAVILAAGRLFLPVLVQVLAQDEIKRLIASLGE